MDKWEKIVVAEHHLALGLIDKSRSLTVAITREYADSTLQIINTVWPGPSLTSGVRKRFTAIEAAKLVGKLGRLAERATWAGYMVSHLYTSIAFALAQNKYAMSHSSSQFKKLAATIDAKKKIRTWDQQSPSKHNPFHTQNIGKDGPSCSNRVWEKRLISLLNLEPASGVAWEFVIAYLMYYCLFGVK